MLFFLCCFISCSKSTNHKCENEAAKNVEEKSAVYGVFRNPIYNSANYGATWNNISVGLPTNVQVSLIDKIENNLIIATDNYGIFIGDKQKPEWKQVGMDLPGKK